MDGLDCLDHLVPLLHPMVLCHEPTFSTELRQVGDGLLVRRLQWPQSPASGFMLSDNPERRRGCVGRLGALVTLLKKDSLGFEPNRYRVGLVSVFANFSRRLVSLALHELAASGNSFCGWRPGIAGHPSGMD